MSRILSTTNQVGFLSVSNADRVASYSKLVPYYCKLLAWSTSPKILYSAKNFYWFTCRRVDSWHEDGDSLNSFDCHRLDLESHYVNKSTDCAAEQTVPCSGYCNYRRRIPDTHNEKRKHIPAFHIDMCRVLCVVATSVKGFIGSTSLTKNKTAEIKIFSKIQILM